MIRNYQVLYLPLLTSLLLKSWQLLSSKGRILLRSVIISYHQLCTKVRYYGMIHKYIINYVSFLTSLDF